MHVKIVLRSTCNCRKLLQRVAAKLESFFMVPDGGALISEGAQLAGFTFRSLGNTRDGHVVYSCFRAGIFWGAGSS